MLAAEVEPHAMIREPLDLVLAVQRVEIRATDAHVLIQCRRGNVLGLFCRSRPEQFGAAYIQAAGASRLSDEAELVISDRVYGRHRDRIDWLVRWARKVFG